MRGDSAYGWATCSSAHRSECVSQPLCHGPAFGLYFWCPGFYSSSLCSTCLDFCFCGQVKFCRLISVGPTSEKGRVDSVQEEEGLRPRLPSLGWAWFVLECVKSCGWGRKCDLGASIHRGADSNCDGHRVPGKRQWPTDFPHSYSDEICAVWHLLIIGVNTGCLSVLEVLLCQRSWGFYFIE